MFLILIALTPCILFAGINAGLNLRRAEHGKRDLQSWLIICSVAAVLCVIGRELRWLMVFLPAGLGMLGGYYYDPSKKEEK